MVKFLIPIELGRYPGISKSLQDSCSSFFNDHFWTTDSRTGLDRCSVFLLYRGNLVFENSHRLTTSEFDEKRPLMKKLEQYYATPEPDTSLEKLHQRAKKSTTKNMIESNPDDSSIEEVGSLPKDTSGSSEVSSEISDHELDDVDIIREFMPTTEPDSSPEEDSDDSGIGHSSSKNMCFSCSQCARERRMKDSLNCEKCASCNKDKNGNIMPDKQLDLEDILNNGESADNEKENAQSDNKLPAIEAKQTVPAIKAKQTVPSIEAKKKLVVKLKHIDFKAYKQTEQTNKKSEDKEEKASDIDDFKERNQTEPKNKETEDKEQTSSDSDSSGSSIEEVAAKRTRKPKSHIGLLVKNIMPNKYNRFV